MTEGEKLKCKWSLISENLSYNSWTISWSPTSICYIKWNRLNRTNWETMTHCFSGIGNCSSSNHSRTLGQEAPFKWTVTASGKHRVNLKPTSFTSAPRPPLPEHPYSRNAFIFSKIQIGRSSDQDDVILWLWNYHWRNAKNNCRSGWTDLKEDTLICILMPTGQGGGPSWINAFLVDLSNNNTFLFNCLIIMLCWII